MDSHLVSLLRVRSCLLLFYIIFFHPLFIYFIFILKMGARFPFLSFFLLLLLIFLDIKLTSENDFLHMVAGIF
jgi:hypothetical protein